VNSCGRELATKNSSSGPRSSSSFSLLHRVFLQQRELRRREDHRQRQEAESSNVSAPKITATIAVTTGITATWRVSA